MPTTLPPARVTYRHLPPSPAITARIQSEVAKLAHYRNDLTSCSVTVETPDRHHLHGRHFRIAIELILPGGVIVVDHQPSARRALLQGSNRAPGKLEEVEATHRDAYVTIRDAFDVARRRLEDTVRRERHRRRDASIPPTDTPAKKRKSP